EINSIYKVGENIVWVGGYAPFYWDGSVWSRPNSSSWPVFDSYGHCNAIWASGPDDVFFVSDGGQINHWNGSNFERMETPTTSRLADIWGTGSDNVWAVGFDVSDGSTTLIHYNGSNWSLKYEGDEDDWYARDENRLSGVIKSVFTHSGDLIYVLSNPNGVYTTLPNNSPGATLQTIDQSWQGMRKIRGIHGNDLFICGNHSGIAHFNGATVYRYPFRGEIDFYAIGVTNNLVVAVGPDLDNRGIAAVIGKR
ncbi:MAG: hypothetical protein ABIA75_15165, partial [Candidatus Neomarinimicrobiota bacterium]